jgi:GntR family transcriptional regulator
VLSSVRIEDNGVPIYVQIRDQFLGAIGRGVLQPGEQLPTMRQVAVALKVDLNTVRHAYEELEEAGAICIRRARGTYVTERPPPLDGARQTKRVDGLARQATALAIAAGLDPVDVAQQMIQIARQRGDGK